MIPAAYVSLGDAQIITTENNPVRGARPVPGSSLQATWDAIVNSVREILKGQLKAKTVLATGVSGESEDDKGIPEVPGGLTKLYIPCDYCDYPPVCGLAWESTEENP